MKVIKKSDQTKIETETCGMLTEVINSNDIPVSVVIANDLKPTKHHYHKKAVEIYWVLSGEIDLAVTKGKKKQEVKLQKGDLAVIKEGEGHEVTKASEKNKVIVINSPPWKKEDEYLI